ncbi:MAG: pitrilysin family protein [Phycisphaerae bacterium]|nr:pitrilysin family protein [Phycisphaerae bacterium]
MTSMKHCSIAFIVAAASLATPFASADIPPRPENLVFAPLKFEPPSPKEFRHVLKDGTVVYMAPSSEFPLVTVSITFKGGDFLDPAEVPGLAGMTAAIMRSGGTATINPADLDEQLDFLATRIGVGGGDTTTTATMNCLKTTLSESMKLFMDILRNPAFDQARLDVQKGETLEGLKQRNDSADSIIGREWPALMYGRDHFEARDMTKASLDAISREKLAEMHAKIFHPGNMIVAVTGDFEPKAMLAMLETAFEGWAKGAPVADPPAPRSEVKPGVFHVQKDIPQGKVFIGLRSIKRDDPDYFPMLVMNDILGGGGFTSRIMQSVRSNEGLAYSAGSRMKTNPWYPGEFQALFQSKSPTVALAIKLIDEEFKRIRTEPVTSQELDTAKNSFVETFPQTFASKDGMLRIFVSDEWTNRPAGYWTTYRAKVMAVTPEDIQRVAQKYLDPSKMAILVVGNWDPIYAGNERASMKDFFGGNVEHLPLRDPLTLEPIK